MKRILFSLTTIAFMGIFGCKKSLLDINQNPNRATNSTAQLTTPVALENAARRANQSYVSLGFWIGYYSTSSGFAKPVETYTYDITSSFMSSVWDNLYNNLEDFDYVERKAIEQDVPVYNAIAKVMKAYDFHQLVDIYGNVPYSNALKGAGSFSPKYDEGQAIYEDLIKKIDTAITIFNTPHTAASINVSLDKAKILLFGGSLTAANIPAFLNKWVRFSNTLKLKLLVQQSQMSGRDAYIKQNLQGLTSSDFLGLAENALVNPGYTTTAAKMNPWYAYFYTSNGTAGDGFKSTVASKYAIDQYKSTNDPRISYFYTKVDTDFTGSVFGDPSGTPKSANIGTPSLSPTANAIIMTAAESLFLQAEAAQRGYISGDAKMLYENAVLASFQHTGNAAAYEDYMAQEDPAIQWDLASDKIALIIGQKWYAMNGINILATYNDYRRTGFPKVPLSTDLSSKGKIPVRLFYPQNEQLLNTANVTAQGTVDVFSTKVFWNK
jgi:hypothetical protein